MHSGGSRGGQFEATASPQTSVAPPLIQMRTFLVLNEVEKELKYILNKQCFTLRWTSRFTCRTLTQPLVDWNQQCYSFVMILFFSYFFTAWDLLRNYKRGRFR